MTRLAFLTLVFLALCGFSRVPSELFRAEALAGIAVEQAAAGNLAGAQETLALVRAAAERISGDDRGTALSHIAWAQASMGDSPGALGTVESMEDPDDRILVLCRIALVQHDAGDASAARHSAGLVLDELQDEPDEVSGLVAMSAPVILGLFGQAAGALAWAEQITDLDSKVPFLLGLAAGQVEAGDKTGARQTAALAAEAARLRESPDPGTELALAWIRAKTGDWTHAIDTAERLPDPVIGALALGLVATVQAREGDATDARETAKRALIELDGLPTDFGEEDGETTILMTLTRSAVSAAQAAAGDLQGALETAEGARRDSLHAWSLAILAAARAASGDRVGARQVLGAATDLARSIEDSEHRAGALTAVLLAQAETGDLAASRETLAAVDELDDGDHGVFVLTVPWGHLLAGDGAGAFGPALDFLTGLHLLSSDWGRSAVVMAQLQAGAGAVDAAMETATSIYDSEDRDNLLWRGASLQSSMGDHDGAVETAMMIENPRWQSWCLSWLAYTRFQAGEAEPAAATFARAVAAARRIENALELFSPAGARAEAIARVASIQAQAGDPTGAEATFAEALVAAESIGDPEARGKTEETIKMYRAVAREEKPSATGEGDAPAADRVPAASDEPALDSAAAEELSDPLARVRALRALARWRTAQGDAGEARRAARRAVWHARAITLRPLRVLALLEAAQALEAAGDRPAARQTLTLLNRIAEGLASPGDRASVLVSKAEMLMNWDDGEGARNSALLAVDAASQMEVGR